jgi:predicted Zn-dependent peptidase
MNLLELLYHEYPVSIDIAGTVESIRKIDKDLLYLCHKTFYHPSNMVVFVAGDVDPAKVVEQVRQNFDRHGYEKQGEIKRIFPDEPKTLAGKRRSQQLTVSQPILRLGFKDDQVGTTGQELLHRDLLTAMVLDAMIGRASPLYTELYESGLIDNRFGYEHTAEVGYGYTYFAGPTRDPAALEEKLIAGIRKVKETGLDPESFERAKKKSLGRILSFMNGLDGVSYVFNDLFFKGISIFDLLPTANALKLEEANARLRHHFDLENYAVSLIEPRG